MAFTTPLSHEVTQGNRALELWLQSLVTYVNALEDLAGDTGAAGATGVTGATGVQGDTGAA